MTLILPKFGHTMETENLVLKNFAHKFLKSNIKILQVRSFGKDKALMVVSSFSLKHRQVKKLLGRLNMFLIGIV